MIVIFSGYNQRAVIAFLRCLTKNNLEDYLIVAASNEDTILKTAYKNKVFCIRKNKELNKQEIFEIVFAIQQQHMGDSLLIPPTTEALNRFLLEYREELEAHQCTIPLVDKALYESISDKKSFWEICKKNGLAVPNEKTLSTEFIEPYVAKPKRYQARNGETYSPILVFNLEAHNEFINKYAVNDFTYQEYISGDSYYLLYYFSKNGKVYSFSQVNYAQQPNGKSILAAAAAKIHEESIAQKYIELFQKLNYFGFVMIEVRKNGDFYYMIEANPRFWGPSQLFVDAGVPFFEQFLKDYKILDKISNTMIDYNAKYLWSGGCKEEILNSQHCVWIDRGKLNVMKQWEDFKKVDIYNRQDTIKIFHNERSSKSNHGGI